MARGGRIPGQLNRRTVAGADWATKIVESEEYRESITRRIKADNLDPRVEQTILHYAYGRPVERVEAKVESVPEGTLDYGATPHEVSDEVQQLAQLLVARTQTGVDSSVN